MLNDKNLETSTAPGAIAPTGTDSLGKDEFLQLKAEYYDEDDYLIRTIIAYDIQQFDDRRLPSTMEIIPAEEEGNKTIVKMKNLKFNDPIQESFFSQQNMKKVR